MNTILIIIGLFILGTMFGSLGSVLMTRLADGVDKKTWKGILFGFSYCPQCKHRLHTKNLIPLVSYFVQKGHCEYCHKPIAKLYPTLEILSGLIFVLTYLGMGNLTLETGNLIFRLLINWLLGLMIVYDLMKYELHVPLRAGTICISLGAQFFFDLGKYGRAFYRSLILGGICFAIYYGAKRYVKMVYKVHKVESPKGLDHKVESGDLKTLGPDDFTTDISEGFGEGDIMMGFLLGTLIPFVFIYNNLSWNRITGFELIILFFILSSLLGIARYGITKLTTNNLQLTVGNCKLLTMHYKLNLIPFIPFMIFAFWLLLLRGKDFIRFVFPG